MKKTITTISTLLTLLLLTGCTFGPDGFYVCKDDDNIFIHFESDYLTTNALSGDLSIKKYERKGLSIELVKNEMPLQMIYDSNLEEVVLEPCVFKKLK